MNKLLIVVKEIDGGTGTFALSLLKIPGSKLVVIQKPKFRSITKDQEKNIFYLRPKKYYKNVYSLNFKSTSSYIEEIFLLKRIINKESPLIVLGIDVYCNIILQITKIIWFKKLKTALSTHIKLLTTLRSKSSKLLTKIIIFMCKLLYNMADINIFVSKELEKETKQILNLKKTVCIYNGIQVLNKKKRGMKMFNSKVILTVARLDAQKDHVTLIKAFKAVHEKVETAQLLIASNGPLRERLENLVRELKIEKKVKFLGWVKDISHYYKTASVFVLSSKREGFGYSLVEAMSYSIPVISSDAEFGPSEILDNGKYGFLVPVGNVEKMTDKITDLLTNKKTYESYSQKSYVRSKIFTEEKMLEQYQNLFNKILS